MRTVIAVLALSVAGAAAAHEVRAGDLTVVHPLARASLGRVPNSAAYMTLRNSGAAPDRLLGASCSCAARVELHGHAMQNGVARMHRIDGLTVPARGTASLAPGGTHLMLLGLKRPLEPGTTVELVLRFQRAGVVKAPVFVTSRVKQDLRRGGGEHAGNHAH